MEKELEDCGDDIEARNASQALFEKVQTWDELVALWVNFYANKICLPTYYDIWTGTGNASAFIQNNKAAMFEAGSRIAKFSLKTGLLFDNGQAGDDAEAKQKAYLSGFAPKRMLPVIRELARSVNYQSGFVMTWWAEDYQTDKTNYALPEGRVWPPLQNRLRDFFVTYYNEGQGFSSMPNIQDAVNILLYPTFSWLSERFRRRLLEEGMIGFFIVDTIFGRNIIIDVLEAFARETEIIVDKPQSRKPSIRRSMHLRSRRKVSRRKQ